MHPPYHRRLRNRTVVVSRTSRGSVKASPPRSRERAQPWPWSLGGWDRCAWLPPSAASWSRGPFAIQWISSRKRRFATWKNRIGDFGGLPALPATFRAWILWGQNRRNEFSSRKAIYLSQKLS